MRSLNTFGSGAEGIDLIGDIHGCARTLMNLLSRLGYKKDGHVFYQPTRKVMFVGDVIDRGPHIVQALRIVKSMVDHGEALCLLGNHEFNALAHETVMSDNACVFIQSGGFKT